MPQSIRSLVHSLTTRQANLSHLRSTVTDSDTIRQIDAILDDIAGQIDKLMEAHT